MKRTLTISLDVDWVYRRAWAWAVERLMAVFGPMRMDYGRVLAQTAQCAGLLNHHLAETVRRSGFRNQSAATA